MNDLEWTPKPGTQVVLFSGHCMKGPDGGRFVRPEEAGLYDVLEDGRLIRIEDSYELKP